MPAGLGITAEFADGRITGSSGVNRYGGAVTTRPGGGFSAGVLWSTMMAGPEPAMRAEAAFHDAVARAAARAATAPARVGENGPS